MASPAASRRSHAASNPGVLGQLPRRTGNGPGGPPGGSLNFGRGGSFGRLGANTNPVPTPAAAPISTTVPKRSPQAAGRGNDPRRGGGFNSFAPSTSPPSTTTKAPIFVDELADSGPEGAKEDAHRLEGEWAFWFMHRNPSRKTSEEEFNRAMKRVGSCDSVESFYPLYLHLRRPSALPPISDIHLFHHPVKPFWEDPANAHGGKWTIRLRKGLSDRLWEGIVLALVGRTLEKAVSEEGEGEREHGEGQDPDEREICGAVLSVRRDEDILAVWHRSGDAELGGDGDSARRVKVALQALLSLPSSTQMTYKLHRSRQ